MFHFITFLSLNVHNEHFLAFNFEVQSSLCFCISITSIMMMEFGDLLQQYGVVIGMDGP